MILTQGQRAALERAKATAANVLPKLELLAAMAGVSEAWRERVAELQTRRDFVVRLADAALSFDNSVGGR